MKKVLALLLAVGMLSASLVGCTQTQSTQQSEGDTSSSTAESDDASKGSEDGTYKAVPSGGVAISDPGVLPIVENTTDMSVYIQQNANVEDYNTNKMTLWYEDKTNVHVVWNAVPEKDALQKLNLLLASGQDLPDVIMSNLTTATVVTNANQGIFIPLNDLIDQYAYWYKDVLEKEETLNDIMKCSDGEQYSMPRVVISLPNSLSGRGWVNRNFLERCGITEVPETTDEFRAMLEAFRDQDANGNGDPNDEIPWVGSTNGWNAYGDNYLMNSFIQWDRDNPYYIEDGTVKAAYVQDAYREGLRFWRGLAADGLFDTTTFTQDNTMLKQVFDGEIARVGFLAMGGQFGVTDQLGDRSREYDSISTMTGPDGYHGVYWSPYSAYGYGVANTVITSGCKNPEMAFRWIDYRYDREVSMRNRLGEPVVDYRIPEEGEMAVDGLPATYDPILQWGTVQNSHWNENGPAYNDFDNNNVKVDDPYELQQYLWNATQENYYPYVNDISCYFNPNTFYDEEDAMIIADIDATLTDYIKQAQAQFVTGDLDIEKDWDQYLSNLKGMRYEERVAVMQKYV